MGEEKGKDEEKKRGEEGNKRNKKKDCEKTNYCNKGDKGKGEVVEEKDRNTV